MFDGKRKTKILSFHPSSLYENGGTSRILRRLYEGNEDYVIALVVSLVKPSLLKGAITEINVRAFFQPQKWMRWRFRNMAYWLSNRLFYPITSYRIKREAKKLDYDILHLVNQGPYSSVLCNEKKRRGKKLWVSFHDYFSTVGSSFKQANRLWNLADRRFVISEEMGKKYNLLFGEREFEIITDGLLQSDISKPEAVQKKPITIYFAGLLHIDYYPLFRVLAETLEYLTDKDFQFKLKLRGTQKLKFLENRRFVVEYLPFTLNDQELKNELDSANILYLPMKFTISDYFKYSLSTKLVSYLGGSGTIFYHGPRDSAACNLLVSANAAFYCTSLQTQDCTYSIESFLNSITTEYSKNSKELAKKKFMLSEMQKKFWKREDCN